MKTLTAWKVSKYGVFSGPNTVKYGPEKPLYFDTFHAVSEDGLLLNECKYFEFSI